MKRILALLLMFTSFGINTSQAYFIAWSCDDMKTMLSSSAPIKFGDSGAYAGAVRVFLVANHLITDTETRKDDNSTGKYKHDYLGTYTRKAVLTFQKTNGIKQTGIVGPKTKEKILELACLE